MDVPMELDLNEMKGENASKPNEDENKRLFNNPKQSDVRFLVDGQTMYGHKQVLASGSPVFESMFFGQLKEKRDVIEIQDLTLVGFQNALRFVYGFHVDFELSELGESYMAGNKYLLHGFNEAFFDYINEILDAENSCLIYEQLIKIGDPEESSLIYVRKVIKSSKKVFKSSRFTEIDQETLISLLSLDALSIAEFDLLLVVSKWVDCEVRRQGLPVNGENRRRVFQPIKGYILFSALAPEKFASCKRIVELVPPDEMAPLLLHLLNKEFPLLIELKTSRKAGASICSVFVDDARYDDYECCDENEYEDFNSIKMLLTVNRKVSICAIHTTFDESAEKLRLEIRDLNHRRLNLKMKRFEKNGRWSFSFDPPFEVNSSFRFLANAGETLAEASEQKELNYKGSVIFTVYRESPNFLTFHCLRGLEFVLLD